MMLSDFDEITSFDKTKEVCIKATNSYINVRLFMYLAYTSWDEDGLEYPYNLFELARNPSIIDKLGNL